MRQSLQRFAPRIHVVLLQPRIPNNTGQIGRSCLGFGNAALHLVGPLGFNITDASVKRSGLDYWPRVDVRMHGDWPVFRDGALRDLSQTGRVVVVSKRAKYGTAALDEAQLFRDVDCNDSDATLTMIYGNEVSGIEDTLVDDPNWIVGQTRLFIPMDTGEEVEDQPVEADVEGGGGGVRSFNLATSVGIGLYEAGRQLRALQREHGGGVV
tara:strand:- start:1408 stop:2037 length:630 start_codon:yes stop_codon:yes gene_type:complete